jgi:hypothetical protein
MHRSAAGRLRLMLGVSVAFAVLVPTPSYASCVYTESDIADQDGMPGVTPETSSGCVDYERGWPTVAGGGEGGTDESGAAGIGGVGRIDAGAGAAVARGGASVTPWLLAAAAGVAGSVLRRRRR